MPSKGRRVITVSQDCYDMIHTARELANVLNEDASAAMPQIKPGYWTLSEVISLATIDWVLETKRVHNKKVTKLEKTMMMKFGFMRQPKGFKVRDDLNVGKAGLPKK